jgi:hypothetical protein
LAKKIAIFWSKMTPERQELGILTKNDPRMLGIGNLDQKMTQKRLELGNGIPSPPLVFGNNFFFSFMVEQSPIKKNNDILRIF